MAKFTQYAIAASQEALEDAGWEPQSEEDRHATVREASARRQLTTGLRRIWAQGVCMGSGIGAFDEVYDTSVAYEKGVSLPSHVPCRQLTTDPVGP